MVSRIGNKQAEGEVGLKTKNADFEVVDEDGKK
jgi:hypothetical protein